MTQATRWNRTELYALKDALVVAVREMGRWASAFAEQARAGEGSLGVSSKSSPGDVVTFADAELQRRLVALLTPLAPEVGFLGEEGLSELRPGASNWVIDPIDGTHNFVRGYPGFAVSVALVDGARPILGVIYDAVDDSVLWAIEGEGAYAGEERLDRRRSARELDPGNPIEHALISSNFTSASAANPIDQALFLEMVQRAAGARSSGSACRDFVGLARGRFDLFWQIGLQPWDVAAGMIILREAQGAVAFAGDEEASEAWLTSSGLGVFAGDPALVALVRGRYLELSARG